MIRNIIFDLGNVILGYNKDEVANKFTNKKDEIEFIKEKIFNAPEWELLDLGEITNDEAIQRIKGRENKRYHKLIEIFLHEWYKAHTINEETIQVAKKLKEKGYNIFVLSNMAKETYEYFENINFFKICTGIVISSYENVKKPNEKVFKLLLERYNLKAEECLFIDDDDTGRSIKVANEIGILGRRVIPNNTGDIIKLLKEFQIII